MPKAVPEALKPTLLSAFVKETLLLLLWATTPNMGKPQIQIQETLKY